MEHIAYFGVLRYGFLGQGVQQLFKGQDLLADGDRRVPEGEKSLCGQWCGGLREHGSFSNFR